MAGKSRNRREWLAVGAALAGFVVLTTYQLSIVPQPWWDEGWTLSVARNWVEHGHYGHYVLGVPTSPALAAHLPVVAVAAAGFALFGVGLIQARLMFVFCAALTLLLLYLVTRDLFSRRTAVLALGIACFFPIQWDLSLFLIGRNVLGEVPSVMFILAAVLALLRSGGTRWWLLGTAAVFFGFALATKAQVVPFVVVALAAACLILLWRDRHLAWRLTGVLGIAALALFGIRWLHSTVLATPGVRPDVVVGLTEVTATVFDMDIRLAALRFAVVSALPLSLGLLAACVRLVGVRRPDASTEWKAAVEGVLLMIGGSWFAWFVFLSIGWGRYAFPPALLASPFVAAFILRLVERVRGFSSWRGDDRRSFRSGLAAVVVLALCVLGTGRQLALGIREFPRSVVDSGLQETATFLNTQTPPGSTIETYESEILFLLDRPVHFPPPQLNVDLIRKNWLDPDWNVPYDLSAVTADYIIVGGFGYGMYDALVTGGAYHPLRRIGAYSLYKRTRNGL